MKRMTKMTKAERQENLKLYDKDFYLWIEETVKQLKNKQFEQLDIDNLIEELNSMERREKREIKNRLIVLLVHLLKWQYQPNKRSNSWRYNIIEQRRQIRFLLEDSPSLKPYYQEGLTIAYQFARQDAANETNLSLNIFPINSPFTAEKILNDDFLP